MWSVPPPLFAGSQSDLAFTIDSDTYVGDLYLFLGSPLGKKAVVITVDGADAGEIIINTSWEVGSTFVFNVINGGRVLGVGGDGGDGGPDFGATGDAGTAGTSGGAAISNSGTYPVSIDVDDGFLFGGGGGGGGGSYTDTGTGGDAGAGGGGGQGFYGGTKGAAGSPYLGLPAPQDGTDGSILAAGNGGGNLSVTSYGGDGGTWGLGGVSGRSSNMIQGPGFSGTFFYYGGLGGSGGDAYSGSGLTLSGSDSETVLRAAGRILGDSGPYISVPTIFNFWGGDIQPTTDDIGISFQTDGKTLEINTTISPTASASYYAPGGAGANFQVRVRGETGDVDGAFDSGTAAGTWVTISSLQSWYWSYTGSGTDAALFEIRRSDIPSVGADSVHSSFFVKASLESEP